MPSSNLMGIALHELAVLKGARLALVGIAAEIARALIVFGKEAPFHAGRESCSASSS